ncbi:MAG: HD domain-containing protein [Clostridia bacterium]|jgi:HD-GYP domain-containing protein (c-di-GMP phosphodiesterase class II)|nr:HD domain-containing protein [Clostridia bacterium]
MFEEKFDFYSPISIKTYNLDQVMRYQLEVLERLDPFTRRHSENVANLCCRICEYLRCTRAFTVHCTICGYLHDVGKMFIPLEILNKPSKLTDDEFEIMKKHTKFGYDMCMKDLKLRPYAIAALDHHEALDGSRLSKWN